jgi:prepilin-type N-terminal cleavage/methylation domain-containing protein
METRWLARLQLFIAVLTASITLLVVVTFFCGLFGTLSDKEHPRPAASHSRQGFTLIELSIVLVIIGLLVGGVLAGQSLIAAAAVRAQISQIERYNTAAATFQGKYGGLPGDLNASLAAKFGLTTRAGIQGRGDGDGILEGYDYDASEACTYSTSTPCYITGEPILFWRDLSSANLIDSAFSTATDSATTNGGWGQWCSSGCANYFISLIIPAAKIGTGNYVYAYGSNAVNFFAVLGIINIGTSPGTIYLAQPSLTVAQAYAIDKKTDDGLPLSGRVIVQAFTNTNWWGNSGGTVSGAWYSGNMDWLGSGGAPGTATPASSTSCYDNGGNASNPMAYSLSQNNGAGVNCALSFKMQAGD